LYCYKKQFYQTLSIEIVSSIFKKKLLKLLKLITKLNLTNTYLYTLNQIIKMISNEVLFEKGVVIDVDTSNDLYSYLFGI